MTEDRFALLYSDGSLGICASTHTVDDAFADAKAGDFNEDDPAHFTSVVRIRFEIAENLGTGRKGGPRKCPTCGRPHEAAHAA